MCDVIFPKAFFTTRNGSTVWTTKGRKGQINAVVIKATEATRRRFPVGTKVVYQNEMGHVMCKGEAEEGKECELHPLDAVSFKDYNWTTSGKLFVALTKKVSEKFKGREVLKVTKGSPKAVQKKRKVEEVVPLRFKDLKAGQKYYYSDAFDKVIYTRNAVPLDAHPGPHNQTLIRPNGYTGWERPDTEVTLVA